MAARLREISRQGPLGSIGPSALGYNPLCSELDALLDTQADALKESVRVGLTTNDTAVQQVYSFVLREENPWQRTNPVLPSTCRRVVSEGTALLEALNRAISAKGGEGLIPPPQVAPPAPGEDKPSWWDKLLSTTRWGVVGAVVVSVAVVAVVIVRTVGKE